MKNIIRLPLDQFAYLETEFEGSAEAAITEYRRLVNVFKTAPVSPKTTPDLLPIPLLRLLYDPICNQGLTEEQVDSLGTSKNYSQRDILKVVQSLINKVVREENKKNN